MWSLADAAGRQYLHDGDPAWWTGRAPLLFPIVGALNGEVYRHGGREYALPKHGFARTSRFDVVDHDADRVLLRLTDSAETRAVYPFTFNLDAEYRLDGMTLRQTVTVTNRGDTDMPFSFGFHTAFAWPLPGGVAKDDHRIVFSEPEPAPIRRISAAGTLLPPQPSPVVARYLHLNDTLFADDALIWDRLHSRALTFDGGTAALDIAFPDTPMLGIWQKPGAPFLAIEPWHGINDPADFAGDINDKPGIILLPPSEARSFRMDVTVRPG